MKSNEVTDSIAEAVGKDKLMEGVPYAVVHAATCLAIEVFLDRASPTFFAGGVKRSIESLKHVGPKVGLTFSDEEAPSA
jgi:hypothetical protein